MLSSPAAKLLSILLGPHKYSCENLCKHGLMSIAYDLNGLKGYKKPYLAMQTCASEMSNYHFKSSMTGLWIYHVFHDQLLHLCAISWTGEEIAMI